MPETRDGRFPKRSLAAFTRIHLEAGQTRRVHFHVAPRQLQFWSVSEKGWHDAPGRRILYVGGSSRDLRLEHPVP